MSSSLSPSLTIARVLPLLLSRQQETAQPEEKKEDQPDQEEPGMIRPEILEQERWLSQRVCQTGGRAWRTWKRRQLETVSDLFLTIVGNK